jgi:hypothetical protein
MMIMMMIAVNYSCQPLHDSIQRNHAFGFVAKTEIKKAKFGIVRHMKLRNMEIQYYLRNEDRAKFGITYEINKDQNLVLRIKLRNSEIWCYVGN